MFAMIPFGQRLREFARELSLSDAEVARRSGLTERRYGHYVTGAREPDLATVLRICRTLNCSPNELLDWPEPAKRRSPQDRLERQLLSAARNLSKAHLEVLVIEAQALARHAPSSRS
jgi:transcriptional regulator with XRE-family HTH domain